MDDRVAVACLAAATLAAQQPAPNAPPQSSFAAAAARAPLTCTDSPRPANHDRAIRQRAALLRPHEQEAGEARRASPRRQCRLHSRGSRSVGPGALRRAHGLQRHEALPEAGDGQVPGIDRHAFRPERERLHELRRNRLHAGGADRQAGRARQGLPHSRGLGAQRLVRRRRNRQGARRHHRGVAASPRRRRAHAGQAVSDPVQGIALRRAAADRRHGSHPELQARTAEEVLRRLVPTRS